MIRHLPIVEPTSDNARIYCWAWNRVYLKANGRIPCWCDSGENHTIVHPDFGAVDFVQDIVNSLQARTMRLKIINENKPYIPQCETCCCFQTQNQPLNKRYQDSKIGISVAEDAHNASQKMIDVAKIRNWPLGSIDRIHEIQLEPSFPCNLKCPGCLHGHTLNPLSTEIGPYVFPIEWLIRLTDSLKRHNVTLERMSFVGRGEPTLNKQFPEMIVHMRRFSPKTSLSMDTNSNQEFKDEYLHLDRINCSIDGSTPQSYSTYRRGGDWHKAIQFMAAAVNRKRALSSKCEIRWKYILFDSTESLTLLDEAQRLAKAIGVDTLDFVITTCGAADGSVKPPQRMNTIAGVNNYLRLQKIFPYTIVSNS